MTEVTPEMIEAGYDEFYTGDHRSEKTRLSAAYTAMRALDPEVERLVIAARAVVFGGHFDNAKDDALSALQELDAASEAFAELVPWDDAP